MFPTISISAFAPDPNKVYSFTITVALTFIELAHITVISSVAVTTFEGVGRFDNPATKSAISSCYLFVYRLCNNVLEVLSPDPPFLMKTRTLLYQTLFKEKLKLNMK